MPVLITVATLLLFPLGWAVAVLLGLDVWRHDWPGAQTMALAMLAAGPIALFLYGGAAWLHREVRAARGA